MEVDFVNWGVGPTGTDLLNRFPIQPSTQDEVMLDNVRSSMKRGLPVVRAFPAHERLLSVASGGPSLEDTWQDLKGVVAAVNGSLQFLLDKGTKPWGVAVMDPGAHMKDIVPRVKGVKYLIASVCDPSLFDHLDGLEVGLWHPGGCEGIHTLLLESGKQWTLIAGGSTMGCRWLNLGYTLGFRGFEFHGMDSCYRVSEEDIIRTHAYPDHTDGEGHIIIDGRHTKLAFVRQVSDFFSMIDTFSETDVEPVTIEMHGDGWLQDRWNEFRKLNPDAFRLKEGNAANEKRKYEHMWSVDRYRTLSPGEKCLPRFVDALGIEPGDSVIDFGCGPSRATQKMKDMGMSVLGIDIADNCRDEGIDIPFRQAVLWDLPEDIEPADWGICCDVMEHIPPDKVNDVLAGIKARTKRGAIFNIALFNDGFGNVIGERLHLTVRDQKWWLERLRAYWPAATIVDTPEDLLGHRKKASWAMFKCPA